MHLFELSQRMAALCVTTALFVACDAQPAAPEIAATTQALNLAPDAGLFPELDVQPNHCSADGGGPESEFFLRPLQQFPEATDPGGRRQSLEAYTAECERIIGFKFR